MLCHGNAFIHDPCDKENSHSGLLRSSCSTVRSRLSDGNIANNTVGCYTNRALQCVSSLSFVVALEHILMIESVFWRTGKVSIERLPLRRDIKHCLFPWSR